MEPKSTFEQWKEKENKRKNSWYYKLGTNLKIGAQNISNSLPYAGLNIPGDILRGFGVNVPETIVTPKVWNTSDPSQSTTDFLKELVQNSAILVGEDIAGGILGRVLSKIKIPKRNKEINKEAIDKIQSTLPVFDKFKGNLGNNKEVQKYLTRTINQNFTVARGIRPSKHLDENNLLNVVGKTVTDTGSGRFSAPSNVSTLYTSNSLQQAKGYAKALHNHEQNGKVFILQPIIKKAKNNLEFVERNIPNVYDGNLSSAKLLDINNVEKEINYTIRRPRRNKVAIKEGVERPKNKYKEGALSNVTKSFREKIKLIDNKKAFLDSYKNSLTNDEMSGLNNLYDFIESGKEITEISPLLEKILHTTPDPVITKTHIKNVAKPIYINPKNTEDLILKNTYKNGLNHYIYLGNENKEVYKVVKTIDPDNIKGVGNRSHTGKYTKGLSQFKQGGYINKTMNFNVKKYRKGKELPQTQGLDPRAIMKEARRNQAIWQQQQQQEEDISAAIARDAANTQAREAVQAARGSFGSYRSPQISVVMPTRTAQIAPVPQITPQTNLANHFKTRGEAFNYARKQGWKTFTYDDGKGKYKQFTTEVAPASGTTTQQTQQLKSTGQQKQATDTGGSLEKHRDHVYDENNLSGPRNINWNQFKVYPPGQESNRRQVMDDVVRQWAEGVNGTDYSELQNRVKQAIDDEWKQTSDYKTGKALKGFGQYTSGTVGNLGFNVVPDVLRSSGVWDVPETWITPTALDRVDVDQTLKEYLPVTGKDALVGAAAIASQGIFDRVLSNTMKAIGAGAGATRAGSTKAIRAGAKQSQKATTNRMLPKGKQQLQITTGQPATKKALPAGGYQAGVRQAERAARGTVGARTHVTPYTSPSGSGIWLPETQFFNQIPANRLLNLPPGAHQMQLPFHKQGGTITKHQWGGIAEIADRIGNYARNRQPVVTTDTVAAPNKYGIPMVLTQKTYPPNLFRKNIKQTTEFSRGSGDGDSYGQGHYPVSTTYTGYYNPNDSSLIKQRVGNPEQVNRMNERMRQAGRTTLSGGYYQQGGAIEDLRINDEMKLEALFRYFQAKGVPQEALIDPETGSFNADYEPDATKFFQTVGEDTAFWSMYKNAPDKAIAEYIATENPDMVEMAKKGAKLKKLQKYKKGNPIKKCSCGCDMITSREEGGKLVSKCACGCKN